MNSNIELCSDHMHCYHMLHTKHCSPANSTKWWVCLFYPVNDKPSDHLIMNGGSLLLVSRSHELLTWPITSGNSTVSDNEVMMEMKGTVARVPTCSDNTDYRGE